MCKKVSEENLADLFTKVLPTKIFEIHLVGLGIKGVENVINYFSCK